MDPNSWMLIRQASQLNAAGVEAFVSGHSELAMQHLNVALVIINKLLLIHCDQYNLASTSRVQSSKGNTPLHDRPDGDEVSVRPSTKEVTCLQDDRFYIYNQALLFSPPTNLCVPSFESPSFATIRAAYIQVSFFWSIIHFNMALVLHKLIHETAENNKRYREEAILFYKLCLQNMWVIPATSATMNFLSLCAVNNFIHIFLNLHSCGGEAVNLEVQPQTTNCSSKAMSLPFGQTELIQELLLRAIGKVISNDQSLSQEEHQQLTEISINHIVISALSPSYVAAGA